MYKNEPKVLMCILHEAHLSWDQPCFKSCRATPGWRLQVTPHSHGSACHLHLFKLLAGATVSTLVT